MLAAGKSLEEIDLLFTPDRKIFVFSDADACSKTSMLQHNLDEDPEGLALELQKKLARADDGYASGEDRVHAAKSQMESSHVEDA